MLGKYLLALLLTIVIEVGVAYLLGFRTSQYMLAVTMVNVITNPILNYLLLVFGWLGLDVPLGVVEILEILVVIAEWQMLVYVFCNPKGKLLVMSILGNTASFLIGLLLFWK
jgi:hypothetical protein